MELAELEAAVGELVAQARAHGLDFFDMHFEVCPADVIHTIGAYGVPTRFGHWSFGKAYYRLKTQYQHNLIRIYELVINADPCYAFLLEGNSPVQNKLVVAHVLAHADFFKNNVHFRRTSRAAVEAMARAAERIRTYELRYGRARVESFLDAAMVVQEHVDPHRGAESPAAEEREVPPTPYDDLWDLDGPRHRSREVGDLAARPEKDVLLFILEHGRELADWERDVLAILRQEMLYFWPLMATRIVNEGWTTYWHLRLLREMDLDEGEAVEFARLHAEVVQPLRWQINPYALGLKIFEDLERRYENSAPHERELNDRPGGQGKQKIFEVRAIEDDVSFIRNYLTREIVDELNLFVYARAGRDWRVVSQDWQLVRDTLVARLANCGFPYIVVEDGDYGRRGELYLKHCYEGMELDVHHLERTLPHVYHLWRRPVHLETILEERRVVFSYDGERVRRSFAD